MGNEKFSNAMIRWNRISRTLGLPYDRLYVNIVFHFQIQWEISPFSTILFSPSAVNNSKKKMANKRENEKKKTPRDITISVWCQQSKGYNQG